eukprot:6460301-Amphidinium_carterae.1
MPYSGVETSGIQRLRLRRWWCGLQECTASHHRLEQQNSSLVGVCVCVAMCVCVCVCVAGGMGLLSRLYCLTSEVFA